MIVNERSERTCSFFVVSALTGRDQPSKTSETRFYLLFKLSASLAAAGSLSANSDIVPEPTERFRDPILNLI